MTVIECIAGLKNLYHAQGVTEETVSEVENRLGLRFADDYREYLLEYGIVSAKGIELTGIISSKRLHVAEVTLQERELQADFPLDMYVIENLGIDGLLLLQKTDGTIYEYAVNRPPIKAYTNLIEYLKTKW